MGTINKAIVTTVVFRLSTSEEDDPRFVTLRYDSEGAGRFLVLENHIDNCQMFFHGPEDLELIATKARELWEQGRIYVDAEGW